MAARVPPTGTPSHLEPLGFTDRTWDRPANLFRGQITMLERMPSAILAPGPAVPMPAGPALDLDRLRVADPLTDRPMRLTELLDCRLRSDGFLVIASGRVLAERYANGLVDTDHHVVHSCSKTLTTMMVGVAMDEGRLDPAAPVQEHITELAGHSAWHGVTVQHLLDMTTGLDTEEHYGNPASMYWRYADAVGYYGARPDAAGTLGFVLAELRARREPPGERFNYASYLTNLLPIMLERIYSRPAADLYEECLYSRLGAEHPAILNIDAHGQPIVEGHVNLTLRDFARWVYPFVSGGLSIAGQRVVPAGWVEATMEPSPQRAEAFRRGLGNAMPGGQYHNQAWILDPASGVLAMLGIHGQFAYVDRPRQLMIVGLSSFPEQASPLLTALRDRIWTAVAAAL